MLKKHFIDERLALLLCIHSNKVVNNISKISLEQIKDICKNVRSLRPQLGISDYETVIMEWAKVYNMEVVGKEINYEGFEEKNIIDEALIYDMGLIDTFVDANNTMTLRRKI